MSGVLTEYRVRPIAADDLGAVIALARAVGKGMTTLPDDRATIEGIVRFSLSSFENPDSASRFTLVLEHASQGVVGIASVIVKAGGNHGFYSYKRTRLQNHSEQLATTVNANIMTLANDYTTATEVGTLFVLPEHRAGGTGRFLARSRYMLMACAPGVFSEVIMAEMRGWQSEDGRSPFWDAVGAKFFGMSFEQADKLSATEGNRFIAELMPRIPICEDLLPGAAQAAIARPHDASAPAMKMLIDEGFLHEGYVDVFDAGPCVHATLPRIRTIANSRVVSARGGSGDPETVSMHLVAPSELASFFCKCALLSLDGNTAVFSSRSAQTLAMIEGRELRVSPL